MLKGNQMEQALVDAGLSAPLSPRKRKQGKQFKCHKCGAVMYKPDNTNVMACPECEKSFFIFSEMR